MNFHAVADFDQDADVLHLACTSGPLRVHQWDLHLDRVWTKDWIIVCWLRFPSLADRSNQDAGVLYQHHSVRANHVGYQIYLLPVVSACFPPKQTDQNQHLRWRFCNHGFLCQYGRCPARSNHAKPRNTMDGKRSSERNRQIRPFESADCHDWACH